MSCQCRSGRRDFVVIVPTAEEWEQIAPIAADFGWEHDAEVRAARVPLGADQGFGDPGEVVSMLRTELSDDLEGFRGHVLDPDADLSEHYGDFIHAEALDTYDSGQTALLDLLRERRIDSWFQPVYAGSDLELWGYECLMRGRDTDGEIVYPDVLLEQAYDQQLQFMLDRVCREEHLRNGYRELPEDIHILLNFLPTAIYEPQFCLRTTLAVIDEIGIDPERVIFEVVESEDVEDRDHLVEILEFYREAGFGVALDDVGAGYSGLAMLGDLAPDVLKIDRDIIWQVEESAQHRSICESLVSMADETNQQVLAEGVETPEQFEFLDSIGIDLFQGYLFRKPAPDPDPTPEWRPSG